MKRKSHKKWGQIKTSCIVADTGWKYSFLTLESGLKTVGIDLLSIFSVRWLFRKRVAGMVNSIRRTVLFVTLKRALFSFVRRPVKALISVTVTFI